MIGVILLIISWLLLRLEKKNLAELGFNLPRQRVTEFGAGFLFMGAFATVQQVLFGLLAHFDWKANPAFGLGEAIEAVRWNFNSVAYEELILEL